MKMTNFIPTLYVAAVASENTGGGCMVDFLKLRDGKYIGINDECICLYKNEEHFWEGRPEVVPTIWLNDEFKETWNGDSNEMIYVEGVAAVGSYDFVHLKNGNIIILGPNDMGLITQSLMRNSEDE